MKWPLTQIEVIPCTLICLSKFSMSPEASFPFKPSALTHHSALTWFSIYCCTRISHTCWCYFTALLPQIIVCNCGLLSSLQFGKSVAIQKQSGKGPPKEPAKLLQPHNWRVGPVSCENVKFQMIGFMKE